MIVLRYVGNDCWVPGVPSRDLTEEDLAEIPYTPAALARFYPPVFELAIDQPTLDIVPIERANLKHIVKIA